MTRAASILHVAAALLLVTRPSLAQEEDLEHRLRRIEAEIARQDRVLTDQDRRLASLDPAAGDLGALDESRIRSAVDRYLESREADLAAPVEAGFDGKFFLRSKDEMFDLKIGGLVQTDLWVFEEDQDRADTFSLQRARLSFEGALWKKNEYRMELELGEGRARLFDGWLNFHYLDEVQLKVGRMKQPFSHDQLVTWWWHDFIYRSAGALSFAPGRDTGAMLHGKLFDDHVAWFAGMFNGVGVGHNEELTGPTNDSDDDKDVAGRIEIRPFRRHESSWLKGLRVAGSVSAGRHESDVLTGKFLKSSALLHFLEFRPGVTGGDDTFRVGADLVWLLGPGSLTVEWMHMDARDLALGARTAPFEGHDVYVAATWLLTGEKKTVPVLIPARSFDPAEGDWGAWELVGRFDWLKLEDDQLLRKGLATGTDELFSWTAGFNWYLNPWVKIQANYIYTALDDSLGAPNEGDDDHAVFLRFHLGF